MALNIKNSRVEALLDEVADLTGESKTEAVRRALEERRERLRTTQGADGRAARLRRLLEREIWPQLPAKVVGRPLTKAEEEALLGYGPAGA